jgi:hypothetical protein
MKKPEPKITPALLDIVFFHFRETNNESEAAEKAGLDYNCFLFHDVMNYLESGKAIEKKCNGLRVTLHGKQWKGFVNEAEGQIAAAKNKN